MLNPPASPTFTGLLLPILLLPILITDDPPSPTPSLSQSIVTFARDNLGQPVGTGECSDLALAALDAAGAQLPELNGPDADTVWGDLIEKRSDLQPGDIIQFRDVTFRGRRRVVRNGRAVIEIYRTDFPHHTAIIDKVQDRGRILVILHQNAGPLNADQSTRRAVQRDTLRIADLRPGGSLLFYRPRPNTQVD